MLATDLLEETFLAISANKARSGLTILGIVIGIGSVIAMISIGQGAAGSIEANILYTCLNLPACSLANRNHSNNRTNTNNNAKNRKARPCLICS